MAKKVPFWPHDQALAILIQDNLADVDRKLEYLRGKLRLRTASPIDRATSLLARGEDLPPALRAELAPLLGAD